MNQIGIKNPKYLQYLDLNRITVVKQPMYYRAASVDTYCCEILIEVSTSLMNLVGCITWWVTEDQCASVMRELQDTYRVKQTIQETIGRLAAMGFDPSGLGCDRLGAEVVRQCGGRLV